MSTSYYKIAPPISSIRVVTEGEHVKITLWESGANIGTLVMSQRGASTFLRMFALDDGGLAPMHTHWGGKEVGSVVTDNAKLSDDTYLISEYSDVMTVKQIKDRAGAKRKDGMPTELFGYEKWDPR